MGFILVVKQLLFPKPKYTSFPNLVFLEDSTEIHGFCKMIDTRVVVAGFKRSKNQI